jgi:RNA polymerase sigma-70 factor (ECF subfamily)
VSETPAPPAARPLDPERLGDHIDRLYRAAWALTGSREQAEDLVQETYARVLAKPRLLRGSDELGYLLRVLRNTFVSGLRTRGRRVEEAPMPEGFDAPDTREERRPDRAIEAAEIYAAVADLPQDFREALVAVDVVGLSYREAARALRVREGTVMSRLFRARKRVADALDV